MNKHTVSIVIPNWNGSELLRKHLPFVLDAKEVDEVIVVDDCSTDNSVAYIKKEFPQVKIILKSKQDGYASSVNAGVKEAKGDIVVLLNTDVRPKKDFILKLLPYFDNQSVFAVGCLDRSHEKENVILRGRGIAHWERGLYIHSKGEVDKKDTAWVSGGSGAFRKAVWEKLGGMDTMYNPFYWEDIDLSYRGRKAGYTVCFAPESIVDHYHEQGVILKKFDAKTVKRIVYRNQFLFVWKNCSDIGILCSHFFWNVVRMFQAMIHGDKEMILGFLSAVAKKPVVLIHRIAASKQWVIKDRFLSQTP